VGLLSGKVAVVTGASRGIGKGIAHALGEEGATVYVTGRTATPGSYPIPGTVGETAAEVDRRGGKGIAVQVDHANDEQVAALFDQVRSEQGRLDLLVNNAFALPEDLTEPLRASHSLFRWKDTSVQIEFENVLDSPCRPRKPARPRSWPPLPGNAGGTHRSGVPAL